MAIGMILALVTLAVYLRATGNDFVDYDDRDYVLENPAVRAGLSWPGARWAFTTTHAANWHPLTWLSLQLDASLYSRGKTTAWGFHLTSVLLHVLNTVFLFAAFRRLTGATWPSALVAALFALHPLHVESVAWVAERKDVLATLFGFGALGAYARYAERPTFVRQLSVALLLFLSLLAKPMFVTLPCLLLVLDWWPLHRNAARSWIALVREKWLLFLLSAWSCLMTLYSQEQGGAVVAESELSRGLRLANALDSYTRYVAKAIYPIDLIAFYPYPPVGRLLWEGIAAGIFLVAATAAAFYFRRRWPYLLAGWLWYIGTLVPVIGVVQVGAQAMADRYTYVPLVGLFLALAWGAADLVRWRRLPIPAVATLALLVLATSAALTWRQIGFWRDNATLWEHALAVEEANYNAHYGLGVAYQDQGDQQRAIAHLQRAVELEPRFADTHSALGTAYLRAGRPGDGIRELTRAVEIVPDQPGTLHQLGLALAGEGDLDRAAKYLRQAVWMQPRNGRYYYDLAFVLQEKGDPRQAREAYRRAMALAPRLPTVFGRHAWSFATSPDPAKRNGMTALRLARQADQATEGQRADLLDILAAAYAETGDFDAAARTAQLSLKLLSEHGSQEDRRIVERRRALYQSRRPFRDDKNEGPIRWTAKPGDVPTEPGP